jgi:hypothetical protein
MAQSLLESFSAERCIHFAKRHIRLSKQIPGAQALNTNVETVMKDVQQKCTAHENALEEKAFAYDLTVFKDVSLDNGVRDAANACKKYDRDNLGSQTFDLVFQNNITPIIETHHLKEPEEVRKVIDRINNLGPNHPLKVQADQLLVHVTESEDSITKYNDALKKVASCEVDLSMARFNLVRTYNNTILDAIKMFGRKNTNRLFPQIHSSSIDDVEDDPVEETPANALT